MNLDFERTRDYLYNFQFQDVFIEELGWEQPSNTKKILSISRIKLIIIKE